MEPRPWSICLSSSDVNLFISHRDIPPAIQTPASSVTMESTFSLEHFSTIAVDLDYVLLLGQPLPEFLCTAWHISSQPAPSVPLILGVMHQTCLVLWTWRKLADETNAKNAPKICWKIVPTWGIQTALAIHITQSQDYPYAKNDYKLVVAIYRTRMTILEQEMTANV